MKKKIVFIANSYIDTLPDFKGYLNSELSKKYQLLFIGESKCDCIQMNKTKFGWSIDIPQQSSRVLFYLRAVSICLRLKPSIIHVFWFPFAFIIPICFRWFVSNTIVIGDFRTKSTSLGFKGMLKDGLLKFESKLFNKCITLDSNLAMHLFGKPANCYIPMGYDREIFYPHHVEKKYDFIYAGSISKERGIFSFIKEFDSITQHKYKFLVIGWGDESHRMEALSNDCNNIVFMGKVPRNKMAYYYSQSQVGISYVDKKVLNIQQPTKILEYIACGNQILANDTIGTKQITNEINFNGQIFSAIKELEHFTFGNMHVYEGRNINEYSWQSLIVLQLLPFYRSLLNK